MAWLVTLVVACGSRTTLDTAPFTSSVTRDAGVDATGPRVPTDAASGRDVCPSAILAGAPRAMSFPHRPDKPADLGSVVSAEQAVIALDDHQSRRARQSHIPYAASGAFEAPPRGSPLRVEAVRRGACRDDQRSARVDRPCGEGVASSVRPKVGRIERGKVAGATLGAPGRSPGEKASSVGRSPR
jgi:hypothetical protein